VRAAAATVRLAHTPAPRVRLSARARRRLLLAAAVAAALATMYLAWFRDSSFVRVERVNVTGLSTADAPRLRAELTAAATRMTTLDVDEGALRAAVANDPLVRSLSARGEFPNALRVDVVLNLPVALLHAGGRTLAVASDGTLLPGARVGSLPAVGVRALPRARRLADGRTLALVGVAGAVPAPLRPHVAAIGSERGKGLVARLREGVTIILGDAQRLDAKWAVAASVLAQGSSAGAAYVDVHDPRQPIAGGLTLGDGALASAQPNPSDPAAPGVIGVTAGGGAQTGQASAAAAPAAASSVGSPAAAATPAAAGSQPPAAPTNTRP
jgi:cell division septal protein FtsQ